MGAFEDKMASRERMLALHPGTAVAASGGSDGGPANSPGRLDVLIQEADEKDPLDYAEVRRIIGLPTIQKLTEEEFEVFCRREIAAEHFDAGFRYLRPQAEALIAYDLEGGLFAPIAVGWGKAGVALGIANRAFKKGLKKILLIVPAPAYYQMTRRDVPWWRSRVDFIVPVHGLGNRTAAQRMEIARSGKSGLYIMPDSLLSVKDTSELLELILAQLVIVDEAHRIKNYKSSAKVKRLMNYYNEHAPEFCVMSGTMTNKSIRDYHHMIRACLKNRCPLPYSTSLVAAWSLVLDAKVETPSIALMRQIQPILEWARGRIASGQIKSEPLGYDLAGLRKAYRHRLTSSPGVVATGEMELGTTLRFKNLPVPNHENAPGFDVVAKHFDNLRQLWVTPNGDPIDHKIHGYKWAYELSAGFYNELRWPSPEVYAERKKISLDQAENILDRAKLHHEAQGEFTKALRKWLDKRSKVRLDTPFLVTSDMDKHGAANVGSDLYGLWRCAKDLEFEGMPERDGAPVRLSSFKVDHVVAWAKALKAEDPRAGALVWVQNKEMGVWMHEALVAAGIAAIHAPQGDHANQVISEPDPVQNPRENRVWREEVATKIVTASITAHGASKNLQAFQHNFFLQTPRSSIVMEQAVGRTHRTGQEADELVMHTCHTLEFDHQNFAACLNDALYAHQIGSRQKLVYGNYETRPLGWTSEFLKENGFQPKHMLTAAQEKLKTEIFQGDAGKGEK